ncbi:MAG: hypothetical protein DHS20C15_30000 [Planctomycetota bacterium]|nr:MAG: hypothetical protein DHS20C15_30000 [Planctomycetota bacterium]
MAERAPDQHGVRRPRSVGQRFVALFGSLELSCTLLLLLGLLTWLGTLAQVEHGLFEVQKKYFESYLLVHWLGPVPIPLPGANLVMSVLFVNLVVGGMLRLRASFDRNLGVLATHLGIALLFLSGFVKLHHSEEGHVTLFEGQSSATYQSYHRWELAISEALPDGSVREHLVPQEAFLQATNAQGVRLQGSDLPFDVELRYFMPNCSVGADGAGGVMLRALPLDAQSERNIAGAQVLLRGHDGSEHAGLVWGRDLHPFGARVAERRFAVDLRHERYPMPFRITLDDFQKEDHPGTGMPKSFLSDVRVQAGPTERAVRISMNEPLRDEGLVLYQASWGPANAAPGAPLFSTLAVVRNPADQWPLIGCIVIALGMAGHFGRMLWRNLRRQGARS